MGQGGSLDQDPNLKAAVNKMSKLELTDIEAVFNELSTKTQEGESVIKQPTWLNRSKFAELFGMNELFMEQLFEAFDRDKNGLIDLDEFVTGMALVLHGNVKDKCKLLFKIFNLDGDDGISPDELSTLLTSCLQSARHLLLIALKSERISGYEDLGPSGDAVLVSVVVDNICLPHHRIVKDAFEKCDVSRTGKLELEEFVHWIQKNPKLMNIFVMQCPKVSSESGSNEKSSTPSVVSEFAVLDTQGTEDIADSQNEVFDDMLSPDNDNKGATTLLCMANTVEQNKQSLQSLFSQPVQGSDDGTFFDTINNTVPIADAPVNPATSKTSIPRSQSALFLEQNLSSNMTSLGGSDPNLNKLPINKMNNLLQQNTGSLQSITLSRDDITEDKLANPVQVGEVAATPQFGENETNNEKAWHPLQDENKNSDVESSVVSNENVEGSSANQENVLQHSAVTKDISSNLENGSGAVPPASRINQNKPVGTDAKVHSFWQPSHRTQQQFNLLQQGQPIDQDMLTFPSVLVEGLMGDPVKDLVAKYLGEQEASKRPTLIADSVELNENGLKKLITASCWRAALDLTTKYLTAYGQGVSSVVKKERTLLTPSLMQIWFVRIALLVKLKLFSSAEAELNAFNDFDSPDMYYQFYPELYPGKKGSMIPFSFRLLHAELPQHNGRPNVALDRLYQLLYKVTPVIQNLENGLSENGGPSEFQNEKEKQECLNVWIQRRLQIHYSLGNCFLGMKEYTLAVKLFIKIIEFEPSRRWAILSGIGRIYLQLGDVKTATIYFQQIDDKTRDVAGLIDMNRGFMSLTKGLYDDAYQHFSSAMKRQPENLAACNNSAVCLLFLGKVKEASNLLEAMVMRSPSKGLHEDVLLNLNTIYELETSRALQKKHKLLDLVSKHKGDGFNVQALKLS